MHSNVVGKIQGSSSYCTGVLIMLKEGIFEAAPRAHNANIRVYIKQKFGLMQMASCEREPRGYILIFKACNIHKILHGRWRVNPYI